MTYCFSIIQAIVSNIKTKQNQFNFASQKQFYNNKLFLNMLKSQNTTTIQSVELLKVLAEQEVKQLNYQKAIQYYTSVLQALPADSAVRIKRSKAYFNLRQYDQSLSDAKQLIRLHPEESEGYLQAASTLLVSACEGESRDILLKGLATVKQEQKKNQILSMLQKFHLLVEQKTAIKLFVEWAVSSDIKFSSGIEINVATPFERLVRAIRNIKKHEYIMLIPRTAIMCYDDTLQIPMIKKLQQDNVRLCSLRHTFLSIYLLLQRQKREQSIFAPYLNILPSRFPNIPINFSSDELALLRGSFFSEQIKQKREQIKCDYNQIIKCVPEFSFSIEEFTWARLVVSSRVFGITIKENRTQALVPFADMCNHSMERQTFWSYNEQMEGFVLESVTDIKAGVEIVDSYGKKFNSKFFLNYGFVIEGNDLMQVVVPIPYEMIVDRASKTKVWEKLFGNRILLRVTNSNHQSFSVLMSVVRFIICTEQELEEIQRAHLITFSEGIRPPLVDFLNIDLEKRCITELCKLLKKQLQAYPTTIEEDRQLLKENKLRPNARNCVILRKQQKQLLQHNIRIQGLIEKVFKARKVNRKKIMEHKDYIPHRRYLEKILSI